MPSFFEMCFVLEVVEEIQQKDVQNYKQYVAFLMNQSTLGQSSLGVLVERVHDIPRVTLILKFDTKLH
jgi:hypothetical protein